MSKYRTVRGLLKDRKRWAQRVYWDGKGAFCLIGAVDEVYRGAGLWKKHAVVDRLQQAIGELFPKFSGRNPVAFNDTKGRKHADILKVVQRARI